MINVWKCRLCKESATVFSIPTGLPYCEKHATQYGVQSEPAFRTNPSS